MKQALSNTTKKTVTSNHSKIVLPDVDTKNVTTIMETYQLSQIAASILAARGFTPGDTLATYLRPTLRNGLIHPLELRNLKEACTLIVETIKARERIVVCCDFDVDGLSGGAQLMAFFQSLGIECEVFVPDRFTEGYGLNNEMVLRAHQSGASLLIAVDYGTTNSEELEYARTLGLRTIVIDHHHVSPGHCSTDVFINPQHPDCGFASGILCASGLVWYVLCGLKPLLKEPAFDPKTYLDLACLGTICDMVPLQGVNRVLAQKGLMILTETHRPGLRALMNVAGVQGKVQAHDVSFGLGPRINAAGRLAHGSLVIELLTTGSQTRAKALADELNRLNHKRQSEERTVKERAIEQIVCQDSLPPGLVAYEKDFHTGVVGIVAQRLVEQFYRPAAVIGTDDEGVLKGSVRGIKGISVVEVLSELKDILLKYGGHEGAGGFALHEEHLKEFIHRFERICLEKLETVDKIPTVRVDAVISIEEASFPLLNEVMKFAPFGIGNRGPVFMLQRVRVDSVRSIGVGHLKVKVVSSGSSIDAVFWKVAEHPALYEGATVNIACRLSRNSYKGYESIQAVIQAVEEV